ncbi:meiosis-specific coiled-coil domain-containing protein MEIOC-like [Oppia nitens]|uniref:meiosis-specific coiled-coil domain-containing protein MEIOC-like n=1 Tax=Oppia nitens TaxID=1686743 RepID=UPI0023DA0B05|nr:meiosis-specific coiled-coil domain-containing protein MEIOC-like [Oppia nitens]
MADKGVSVNQSWDPLNYPQNLFANTTVRPVRSIRARSWTNCLESTNQLQYELDKCYEQLKHLEKDRKKIECQLNEAFVGHRISSANNIPIQRMPPNATKIDKIITDMSREHAKVITIVYKMEQLMGRELADTIHNTLEKWVETLRHLQMKRKFQMQRNAINTVVNGLSDDPLMEQMCAVLKVLSLTVRSVRTALWSSSVISLYDTFQ